MGGDSLVTADVIHPLYVPVPVVFCDEGIAGIVGGTLNGLAPAGDRLVLTVTAVKGNRTFKPAHHVGVVL